MPFEPTPPAVDVAAIDSALDAVISDLNAVNINLTKDERGSAGSVAEQRAPFVNDYFGNKGDYSNLLPGFMVEADADSHFDLHTDMNETVVKALRLVELITDIQMNSEHFSMEYALEGYAVAGRAKEKNVPGADTFYDLLSKYFEDQGNPGDPGPGDPTP